VVWENSVESKLHCRNNYGGSDWQQSKFIKLL
jgi:hypothetical protein